MSMTGNVRAHRRFPLRRSCAAAATSAAARTGSSSAARVERDAALLNQLAHRAAAPRVEEVRAAADVLAADEDLRDRLRARARREHGADLAAAVAGWYATESRSTLRYAMPSRANSLRTDQQNSHHSSANSTTGSRAMSVVDEPLGLGIERDGTALPARRGAGDAARAAAHRSGTPASSATARAPRRPSPRRCPRTAASTGSARRCRAACRRCSCRAASGARRAARPRAWRRSTCRRRCLRGAPARARGAAPRRRRPARPRRRAARRRRPRSGAR